MRPRLFAVPLSVAALAAVLVAVPRPSAAQGPGEPDPGYEVLARGPVHEAYAATAEFPVAGPVVNRQPPEPIEELPPEQRPAGENVQWIPGYWDWEEERSDFIWVSGFWRAPPPGRVWVPGHWQPVQGGFQWVQGFWQEAVTAEQPQSEIEYLPSPPPPLETAVIPRPDERHFFVPGCWIWRGDHYAWRPGFWIEHRPNWVWVPAHYKWTPIGYIFVEGYWDYTLVDRGVLFAPVAFREVVVRRPAFVYTPTYVVSYHSMYTSLFVRQGHGTYYFGDYFEPRYVERGYVPWAAPAFRQANFAININFGRRQLYDPLWSYYQTAYRSEPQWSRSVAEVYAGRYKGDYPRPPRTLQQQTTAVNNITNNTSNVTNNVTKTTVINNVTMVAPISNIQSVAPANTKLVMRPVQREERVREQAMANQLREVSQQRKQLEVKLAAQTPPPAPVRPPAPGQPAPKQPDPTRPTQQPRQVKLEIPKQVTARAQAAPTVKEKAPPPPPKQVTENTRPRPGQPPKGIDPKQPPMKPMQPVPPAPMPKDPKAPPKKEEPKQPPKGQDPKAPPKKEEAKKKEEPKKKDPPVTPMTPAPPAPPPAPVDPKGKVPARPQDPKKPTTPPKSPGAPPLPTDPKGKAPAPAPKDPKGQPLPSIPVPKGAPVKPGQPTPPKGGDPKKPAPPPAPMPRPPGATPPPVPPGTPVPPPQPPGKSDKRPGKADEKKPKKPDAKEKKG